jgi:hypothetical protein
VHVFQKLSRLLIWLGIRLAIAMVAAVSATGFGLLAVPPAHAGLDEPVRLEQDHQVFSPLPSR